MNNKQIEEQDFEGKLIITGSCVFFFMIFAVLAFQYFSFNFILGCFLGIFFIAISYILMYIVDKK